jgi:hypothetical protein
VGTVLKNIKKIKFICDGCAATCEHDGPLVAAIASARAKGWTVSSGRVACWCPACVPAHNRAVKAMYADSIYNLLDAVDSS